MQSTRSKTIRRLAIFLMLLAAPGAYASQAALKACLKNWGEHPFDENNLNYRTLGAKVSVFGIGNAMTDGVVTDKPALIYVKPNVSVMTKSRMNLMNPNGWYCLKGKVSVMSKSIINLHCDAHLASSKEGTTVLGSSEGDKDVTVMGKTVINRKCDKK